MRLSAPTALLLTAGLIAGCARNPSPSAAAGVAAVIPDAALQHRLEAELLPLEQATADAWNRADLDAHVSAYADSAVFMAPGPVIGRDRIRASLERSFWRDGRPVQQLRYEQTRVWPLDRDNALMTGRFVLYGGGRAERSGWFTLAWQRTPRGWRIVHDHSS